MCTTIVIVIVITLERGKTNFFNCIALSRIQNKPAK